LKIEAQGRIASLVPAPTVTSSGNSSSFNKPSFFKIIFLDRFRFLPVFWPMSFDGCLPGAALP
jgi:hypothetical protein